MNIILKATGITKSFKQGEQILKGISLDIAEKLSLIHI